MHSQKVKKQLKLQQKSKGAESFAISLNHSIPRDAPCGYRPDWSTLSESVSKRFETRTEVEANKKAQVGVSWTAMAAKLSCGEGFEKGVANLQRAIERKDVIVRNDVYYEPTHILEVALLHSSGVEGSSAVQ